MRGVPGHIENHANLLGQLLSLPHVRVDQLQIVGELRPLRRKAAHNAGFRLALDRECDAEHGQQRRAAFDNRFHLMLLSKTSCSSR